MQPSDASVPWLERFVPGGHAPERTPIQSLPFSIGRIDTADLQINSTRVSREHAVIILEGGTHRIRDLGSTNGTFVNGQRIEEVVLNDGDMVVIADCEFSFVSGAKAARSNATQVMNGDAAPRVDRREQIAAVRRLQESLLHCAVTPRLEPILNLETGTLFGYRSLAGGGSERAVESDPNAVVPSAANTSAWRTLQLRRLLASEAFLKLEQDALLLLELRPDEVTRGFGTEAHLLRLRHLVGDTRLVVGIAANSVTDAPEVGELCARLTHVGFRLAYLDFLGSKAQVLQIADPVPDFLVLAPNFARELQAGKGGNRQVRQLPAVLEACQEIGSRPIVTGISTKEEEDACYKLGFQYVITPRFGRKPSTSSVAKLLKSNDPRVESFA
jgi:EAL domain-containing protein (putative c-di-GMP-specific phosphodiesterase class I)